VGEKKRSHLRGVDEGIDGLSIWIPRNARNAAEIHGFCAAVPEDAMGRAARDGNFVAWI
jgi:hypothetical protein